MKSKPNTRLHLPRTELLAALDRAYNRLAVAQSDAEVMEALSPLLGDIGSLLKVAATQEFKSPVIKDIQSEVVERISAYRKLQRWESAPNTLQLRSETTVARRPIPSGRVAEISETLEGILGEPETWNTKLE
jgi:hypothetical protein